MKTKLENEAICNTYNATTYIHYGHKRFNKYLFVPVKNIYSWNKPMGGLWASPENAQFGWREWCEAEHFTRCRRDISFRFRLSVTANILHIRCVEDARGLPQQEHTLSRLIYPDFEKLLENGVDAIELHLSHAPELYKELYGWNCDCILIMNPDVVEAIEE